MRKHNETSNLFLQHLPERFLTIERGWLAVKSAIGEKQLQRSLLTHIQDLVGSSGKAGLVDISENAYTLESLLSMLLARQNPPDSEQISRIDKQISSLKQRVSTAVSSQFSSSVDPDNKLAFFLRTSDEIAPGLTSTLQGIGFSTLPFIHPDEIEDELKKRMPDILIFDGIFLDQMAKLNREIEMQEAQSRKEIPIICLSSSKKLELRLQALRMGVDAYLLQPFSNQKLVEKIQQLTAPKDEAYRILIVEDDPSQAKFASSILEKGGMKALAVTDSMRALDTLSSFRPDLILMDLYMPGADGKELTTIIREHPDYITTPIVFLSGEHDTDKKLHALSAGGDDFLTKPIRPKHLINTIYNRVQRAKTLNTKNQSTADSLMGPAARHYLYEQIEALLTDEKQPVPAGVLFIGYFDAKGNTANYNDDQNSSLTKALSKVISDVVEENDIVTELENGIAILANANNASSLLSLASKIQNTIRHHYFQLDENDVRLNTSVGISLFDKGVTSASQMIDHATIAAREAVKGGGEKILIFDHQLSTNDDKDKEGNLYALLDQAIKEDDFQVIFQPLTSPKFPKTEITDLNLRLRHGREIIPKSDWRPVAIQRGLITEIDRIAAMHALAVLEAKRHEGKQIKLFVNQSFQSVRELSNIDWLQEQFRIRQIVGSGLVFEYPVAELVQDLKTTKSFISELKEMGIEISLSGFSANTAALRVLQFLQSHYVRLSTQALKNDQENADKLIREIHILGSKSILPRVSDPSLIPSHWLSLTDLQPEL